MVTLFYLFCLFYLSHCLVSNSRERKTSKMFHRKALTLEEKIILIKENRNGHDLSVREFVAKYKISRSSAANILRRSEEFPPDYSSNCNKGLNADSRMKIDKKSMNLSLNGSHNNVLNKFLYLVPFYKKRRGNSLNN